MAGAAATFFGGDLPIAESSVGSCIQLLLSYAAVAFGFSLAGLTLALSPTERLKEILVRASDPPPDGAASDAVPDLAANAYSRLLFVFSWAALSHLAVIVLAFSFVLVRGFNTTIGPANFGSQMLGGLLVAVAAYAVMQFVETILTLTFVGRTYIALVLHDAKE